MIRWVDMVDLRGKPPYLPDSKTYTDVLKQAIEDAFKYYGYNPETYLESSPEVSGLLDERPRAFPAMKRSSVLPLPSLVTMKPQEQTAQNVTTQNVTTQISPLIPSIVTNFPAISVPTMSSNSVVLQQDNSVLSDVNDNDVNNIEGDDDDDEDDENLPPKLPMPIGKMNCSLTRTVLAKLIRFHCGNQVKQFSVTSLFKYLVTLIAKINRVKIVLWIGKNVPPSREHLSFSK